MMLRKLKLKSRLAIGFTLLIAFGMMPLGICLHAMGQSEKAAMGIMSAQIPKMKQSAHMVDDANEFARVIRNLYLLDPSSEQWQKEEQRVQKIRKSFDAHADTLLALGLDSLELEKFQQARNDWKAAIPLQNQILKQASVPALRSEGVQTLLSTYREAQKKYMSSTQELGNLESQSADQGVLNIHKTITQGYEWTMTLMVALLFFVSFLVWKLSASLLGPVKECLEMARDLSAGRLESKYKISGNDEMTELMSALANSSLCLQQMVQSVNYISQEMLHGRLHARTQEQSIEGDYRKMLSGLDQMADTIVKILDNLPIPIMINNMDFEIQYLNLAALALHEKSHEKEFGLGSKCFDFMKTQDCQSERCACQKSRQSKQIEDSRTLARPKEELQVHYHSVPLYDQKGSIIANLQSIVDETDFFKNQQRLNDLNEYQESEFQKIQRILSGVAQGDLTLVYEVKKVNHVDAVVQDRFVQLSYILQEMLESLQGIMGKFQGVASQIAQGSKELASTSQHVSSGATESAASLEEIGSSIGELSEKTKENTNHARDSRLNANSTNHSAKKGADLMQQMVGAMEEIEVSSHNTSKIIKVIDEIAFQTNLLALNAAVEAARAGIHGKGFAVVAEEVRALAARSAKAAKETAEMLDQTISRVGSGMRLVHSTQASLDDIVSQVAHVSHLVEQISEASEKQEEGIVLIQNGIKQLDAVTQQNSALAEETAASSEELNAQALVLHESIQKFKFN